MKKITVIVSICVTLLIAGYNVYSSQICLELPNLLLANVDALANDDEYPEAKDYNWSGDIDCPGWWTGDYRVCQENGPGNTCSAPGAVTCNCGTNC